MTNALVGEKVAITSVRPQTTRRAIRGIVNLPDASSSSSTTPGLHRPRTLLGERLNDLVRDTLAEVDVIVFALPANEKVGPGDRFIAARLVPARTIAVATKSDLVGPERLATHLLDIAALGEWAEIIPVSAAPATNSTSSSSCWSTGCRKGHCSTQTVNPPTNLSTSVSPNSSEKPPSTECVKNCPIRWLFLLKKSCRGKVGPPWFEPTYTSNVTPKRPSSSRKRCTASRRRHPCPYRNRGPARHPCLSRPACSGGQGLAAGPEALTSSGILTRAGNTSTKGGTGVWDPSTARTHHRPSG
jgi:hypothetical protein